MPLNNKCNQTEKNVDNFLKSQFQIVSIDQGSWLTIPNKKPCAICAVTTPVSGIAIAERILEYQVLNRFLQSYLQQKITCDATYVVEYLHNTYI